MKNNLILVVDDEIDIRTLLEKILVSVGYKVITACNGREAMEKVSLYNPALVITDLAMPEQTGDLTVYQIKNDDKLKEIITVIMTAIDHVVAKELSEWAGADYFLLKPFNRENITELILKIEQDYSVTQFKK